MLYLKFETLKKQIKKSKQFQQNKLTLLPLLLLFCLCRFIYFSAEFFLSLSQEKLKLFKSQEGAEKQQKRENTRQKTTSKLE